MTSEWDTVACLPIVNVSQSYQQKISSPNFYQVDLSDGDHQEVSFVTSQQLVNYIEQLDVSQYLSNITVERKSTSWLQWLRYVLCCRKISLSEPIKCERNRLFAVAMHQFDNRDKLHSQCLYTIYAKLTGDVINGHRRFGHHWEEIGFQGTDPATDLRGVGILGLIQLTFFVVSPQTWPLCKQIYDLSLDSVQHFPFAITSMNMTQIALQVVREGWLNRYMQHSGSALQVFNQFYAATFLTFFQIWKEQHKTIMDTGYVLQDLRIFVRKNVNKLMKEKLLQHKQTHHQQKNEEEVEHMRNDGDNDEYEQRFTNINNII